MTFVEWLQRYRRARNLIVLALVAVGALATVFATPLGRVLAPTCPERPSYHADVPPGTRAVLDALFDNELLYCATPAEPFAGLDGPVYWGSDGLSSWVFFQAASLRGVGLTRYAFGQDFAVSAPGDRPPPGYVAVAPRGRQNQAEGENPTYFVRRDGPPTAGDARVFVRLRGPRPPTASVPGGRSVWRDLDRLVGMIRGDDLAADTVPSEVQIARRATQLVDQVERRVAPELAAPDGSPDAALLAGIAPGRPVVWQTLTGLMGNSVWVAGVVTDTLPALWLAPPGGAAVAPFETSLWRGDAGMPAMALFAFDPVSTGTPLSARFWADGRDAAAEPPEAEWTIEFP